MGSGTETAPFSPPQRNRRAGHGHKWLTLLSVSFGLMMVALDGTVVSIANATIGKDLHASLSGLQWVTNGYLLAVATGLIIGGKLGDLYGRKRIFLAGVVVFALCSLGAGLSSSIGMLIGFRVLQGLGGALMMPGTLAILRATFPPEELQMAIGIWAGASSVSTASGPIVGGLLVEHVNWQSIFYINLGIGAIALLIGLWVIEESRDESAHGIDLPGGALAAAAFFLLVWGIVKSESYGWGSLYTLGFLSGAAVAFLALAAWLLRTRSPLVRPALFRNVSLDAGLVLVHAVAFALFGVIFFVTLFLQRVNGYSPVQAGVRMLPLTGVLAFSAPLGGVLGTRIRPRYQLAVGLALVAGGLLGLRDLQPSSGFGALWPWFLLMGLGMGVSLVSASQTILAAAPVADAGIASGLQQTAMQVGGALGTAVLGAILTNRITANLLPTLLGHGVPAATAHAVASQPDALAQGVVAIPPGTPPQVAAKATDAAFATLTSGMHVAFLVAAAVAAAGALVGLLFVRVKSAGDAAMPA